MVKMAQARAAKAAAKRLLIEEVMALVLFLGEIAGER
jgi:hypothetical protein